MVFDTLKEKLTKPIGGIGKVFALVFIVIMVLLVYLSSIGLFNGNSAVRVRWAATRGQSEAQYRMAQKYLYGCYSCRITRDYVRAVYWFRRAAKQGDLYAKRSLSVRYSLGQGVEQDYEQAEYWIHRATR